jgi:hypothetical protein
LNLGYIQGFNEIITVIYYAISTERLWFTNDDEVEAVSYFLFFQMMTDTKLKTLFDLKDSLVGLQRGMDAFMQLLKVHQKGSSASIQGLVHGNFLRILLLS